MPENLLEVFNVKKYFPITGGLTRKVIGEVKAVDGVSFSVRRGETFGLVGETGCGKTTLGRTILRLLEPTSGEAYINLSKDSSTISDFQDYEKINIFQIKRGTLKRLRRHMQIVYQDPFSSLNPRMLVKDIVAEPMKVNKMVKGQELQARVIDLLEKVGLMREHLFRFPHEFSGGQRQRICIARAIALNPTFLLLDEPTSALDVSVQAQILKLLNDLQSELDLTYMLITHDLSIIDHMADRLAVMYLGKIVEIAEKDELFKNPLHPYTQALLSAVPIPDPDRQSLKEAIYLRGEVPSPVNPPEGCRFHPRCKEFSQVCEKRLQEEPPLIEVSEGHFVACFKFLDA
jgi:oligopeptide/dipeptide ABC transporter ATP-binding protein